MHFNWLRSLFADNRSTKRTSRKRRPWVSAVETLEARAVPAIYHVTGLTDGAGVISASGVDFNATTLRAAITDANLQPGDDTIVLPSGTYTINTSGEGELLITSNISIDGAGASETIIDNGYRAGRVFHIAGDGNRVVTIEGVTITGGLVTDEGGGILLDIATLNLTRSVVTYNAVDSPTGDVYGGGISVNVGTLRVTDSTISYNSAYGGDGAQLGGGQTDGYLAAGGGIATRFGSVDLLRSTVDHNNIYGGTGVLASSNYYGGAAMGGGIAILGGVLRTTHSTIANNSANGGQGINGGEGHGGAAYGGGIYVDRESLGTTIGATIAYNSASGGTSVHNGTAPGTGGGVALESRFEYFLGNTIVAQNTASASNPDVSGTVSSYYRNLIGDVGTSSGWGTFELLGGNGAPVIDPLFTGNQVANNGGLTFTLGLQRTSPAVDFGADAGLFASDQRGLPYRRVVGPADIGAFELQGPAVGTTPGSTEYIAGSPAVVVDAGVLVFDSQDVTSATVTISGGLAAGDVLAYPAVIGNITGSYLNGVLTLTGQDTAANYQLALRSITYRNTNSNPNAANRTISFAATDSIGTSSSPTRVVTITILNNAPTVANTILPQTAIEDTAFNFTFALNTFADVDQGDTLTYTATGLPAWLSFDGATRTFSGTPANGDVTTSPLTITVTATDSFLATVSTTFALTVTNVNDTPTVAAPIGPQTATEDTAFSFTFGVNTFADVDVGDTLIYTATGLPAWLSFDGATRTFTGTPTNGDVTTSPVTITVTATDGSLAATSTTFALSVTNVNDAPTVANVISPQTATEDTAFSFTFGVNTFADVDVGDTLAYTATGLPAWLSFDGATRTFTGTPANGDVTTIPLTITVTATDGSLATTSTTFALTVTNVNDAPTVATPIGPQTAPEDTAFSFTFGVNTFADVDVGDTLAYTATGLPSWLSFDGATRTFTGTPANGDVTTTPLTITVTATDGSQATVSTTFALSVTNVNDAPTVATPLAPQTATEDTAFSFIFGVNTFADVDVGDTLTYTATGLPAWLSFDGATRTFSGTPANGDVTTTPLTITVTATDGSLATVSTTFDLTVTNVNDAPTVANIIAPQTATEDTAFSFTFGVNTFADVDVGDTLTYTATGLPSWLSFDAVTRTFTGTPDDADTGTSPLTITVTATDSALAAVSTTFQLTIIPVNDHTPVFTAPSQTVSLLEFSPNGTTVATVHATDDDLPAEALQYSITGGNASGAFAIDPTTGVITVADASKLVHDTTPTFVLTISVTDQGTPSPLTATATVTVNLTQTGPTITLSEVQGTYHIGKNTALVSPLATFTNNADDNPDFSAAQLTVSITAGRSSKDVLSVLAKGDPSGHIRVKGRNVFYDNVKIGTVKGGKGRQPDLVVTFNAQASTAAVDALLRRVNITAKDQIGQTRTVQFQITNISGVDSNTATRDIQVVPPR